VHTDPSHLYFITTRAVGGARVFQRDVVKRILVDSLNTGRILGQYELYAFVVMPNHVHMVIRCLGDWQVGGVVREMKKSTAGLILRQYEAEDNADVIAFFAASVKAEQKQNYAVWENEYQAKDIITPDFLRQKMEYIHNNPLQPHWRLADQAEHYVWSSARFYLTGKRPLIPLSDARELLA
jgi:REP element-mobilizing transposase RayT